ncbi:hypothetical protein E4U31_008033 [Claviceps sp. LM219 group G6]|nr:hypothetical protein E4U31_008033 [Claviceps sp. LM219 group G6]
MLDCKLGKLELIAVAVLEAVFSDDGEEAAEEAAEVAPEAAEILACVLSSLFELEDPMKLIGAVADETDSVINAEGAVEASGVLTRVGNLSFKLVGYAVPEERERELAEAAVEAADMLDCKLGKLELIAVAVLEAVFSDDGEEAAMLVCVLGGSFGFDDPFELSDAAVPDTGSVVENEENVETSDKTADVRDFPENYAISEVEAIIDAEGKLDPLASDKLEIGAELEVEIALKTSTEFDATLELEVMPGLEMRPWLEAAPGKEVGVVCEPRAGVESEVDVDGNSVVLILAVLILDRPGKLNISPDNAGPGSMVKASDSVSCGVDPGMELYATPELDAALDPDKVDSVTGSVKVVGRDARSDKTVADETRLELIAELGDIVAEKVEPTDCELETRADDDGPDDAVADEIGLDSLETEEVGSFEPDGVDLKSRFGPGTSRVDDTSPSDVRPDDGLPDDTGRNEILVKPEGVPDDVGPESERLEGGCVSDDIDPLDDDVDDRLGDNDVAELKEAVSDDAKLETVMADVAPDSPLDMLEVGDCSPDTLEAVLALTSVELTVDRELFESKETDPRLAETRSEDAIVSIVVDEPREVRSDEPRRTLVMKPEEVNAGHEGLEEDREEEEGPETAEEGVTSEPDEMSVELEPKVDDTSWVVDPTSEDVVPNGSVVDTLRDETWDAELVVPGREVSSNDDTETCADEDAPDRDGVWLDNLVSDTVCELEAGAASDENERDETGMKLEVEASDVETDDASRDDVKLKLETRTEEVEPNTETSELEDTPKLGRPEE